MLIRDFLICLLDDSLESARMQHLMQPDAAAFAGACRAVDECREAMLGDDMRLRLSRLLDEARTASSDAMAGEAADAMYWIGRELVVAWVAEVVSVVLMQRGLPHIVRPRMQAAAEAARLVTGRSPDWA